MLKLGKKFDKGGKNMNKYDFNDIVIKIKLLELKLKRISFEKRHHNNLKYHAFSFKKRKKWIEKYNFLLEEEEISFANLYNAYEEFSQMMSLKKKQ